MGIKKEQVEVKIKRNNMPPSAAAAMMANGNGGL